VKRFDIAAFSPSGVRATEVAEGVLVANQQLIERTRSSNRAVAENHVLSFMRNHRGKACFVWKTSIKPRLRTMV